MTSLPKLFALHFTLPSAKQKKIKENKRRLNE
jgi:hypothetical protein